MTPLVHTKMPVAGYDVLISQHRITDKIPKIKHFVNNFDNFSKLRANCNFEPYDGFNRPLGTNTQ